MSQENSEIQCKKCGKSLPANAKFCNNCGADIGPANMILPQASTGNSQQTNPPSNPSSGKGIPPRNRTMTYILAGIAVLGIIYLGYGWVQKQRLAKIQKLNNEIVIAVNEGNATQLTELLKKGGSPNATDNTGIPVLILASLNGQTEIVKILLDNKTDVNITVSDGETPLMAASARGHLDIVQELVKAGADKTPTDKDGWSALEFAVNQKQTKVANYLEK